MRTVGIKTRDKTWVSRVKKSFIKKFYAASTLTTKNTKRKRVTEILENIVCQHFPLTGDLITTLAAVLDSTGMKAGDQYLAETKLMHIEAGFEWSQLLETQMGICKRAMQRDKGPARA